MQQIAIANLKCELLEAAAYHCQKKIYGYCNGNKDMFALYTELKFLQSNCTSTDLDKLKTNIILENQ